MRKFVMLIDDNNDFVRDTLVDKLNRHTVETRCPDGMYKARWTGVWDEEKETWNQEAEWIETGTPPEPTIPEPTIEERLRAAEDAVLMLISLGGM